MSDLRKTNYFSERALEERRAMETAIDPRSVSAHAELVARYEALAAYPSFDLSAQRSASG